METYNIYMDEASADALNGDSDLEVTFRVVAASEDTDNAEEDAVIVGLDLVDLIDLRNAIQVEIDNFALQAFDSSLLLEAGDMDEEDLP